MKAKNLFLIIILLSANLAYSQTAGKISGVVTDESGEPLVGCNVMVEGMELGAATDLDGYYMILNIPPGTYNVRAEMIGYGIEEVRNVKVMGNLTTKLSFVLQEAAIEGEIVEVTDYRIPPVQKDLTYKVQS
ncbi:MAG: TonB-dependent receptor, partial [Aliifodinibius sp.]|nr:carboxypeptidase-like regulatory domain-containing protein [Fodinibius sp.]NIV12174.1 TonB-dependent receptor [Fodinibius sp.]NIY25834.1 TonB-dependent receptor [Fodinibius sp.]